MSANATEQGGEIRAARKALGLSQQRVAELAGCSVSYVRLLEFGYQPADSYVLPRLLRALNDAESGALNPDSAEKTADDGGSLKHKE